RKMPPGRTRARRASTPNTVRGGHLRCVLEDTKLAGIRTFMAQPGKVKQNWWVVDASDKIVGRLASDIAMVLMGKHLPTYTPHVDCGDFVIVTNATKVKFTGKKWQQKKYTWFTGYTRQRSVTAEKQLTQKPEKIIEEAVRRMLP